MKTRTLITAAIILFSVTMASATPKQFSLTFFDSQGDTFTIPMMAEEAEATPFDTADGFSQVEDKDTLHIIDISPLIEPEKEEDLPFDLDAVLQTIK